MTPAHRRLGALLLGTAHPARVLELQRERAALHRLEDITLQVALALTLCTCDHRGDEHGPEGEDHCTGTDSYGLPCSCPSLEPDTEPDDPEDQR